MSDDTKTQYLQAVAERESAVSAYGRHPSPENRERLLSARRAEADLGALLDAVERGQAEARRDAALVEARAREEEVAQLRGMPERRNAYAVLACARLTSGVHALHAEIQAAIKAGAEYDREAWRLSALTGQKPAATSATVIGRMLKAAIAESLELREATQAISEWCPPTAYAVSPRVQVDYNPNAGQDPDEDAAPPRATPGITVEAD